MDISILMGPELRFEPTVGSGLYFNEREYRGTIIS